MKWRCGGPSLSLPAGIIAACAPTSGSGGALDPRGGGF
jgi:hypothetical protein